MLNWMWVTPEEFKRAARLASHLGHDPRNSMPAQHWALGTVQHGRSEYIANKALSSGGGRIVHRVAGDP